IENLQTIADEERMHSNFAISLLNNVAGYRDYILDEPVYTDVLRTDNIRRIENNGSYLNIYPNPVKNTAYIEFLNNTEGDSKIEVFDITGKLVNKISISIVAGGFEMDVQQLRGGIYFVTITDPESGFIQKGKMVKVENQ
ncbi:MAG: T9SS type A sorting domain-containing protein, partial [Proteobacteria bacterium]|nr:T9SS type A sorting domain-containing protein [Pseudomonadota bacterium]